jgi:hypothetical protein
MGAPVKSRRISPREFLELDFCSSTETAFEHPLFQTKEMLRIRAIVAFDGMCAYCGECGDERLGPDGRPWHLDRIWPGALGGEYTEDNVTLSCSTCNCSKCDTYNRDDHVRSLSDREWKRSKDRYEERRAIEEWNAARSANQDQPEAIN